jgi:stage IV sporulation protein FB
VKKVGLHPVFVILGIFLIVLGEAVIFFNYLLAVVLHEMAHSFTAKKLGYSLNKFFLMPYGAGISFKQDFLCEKDEIIIASAGPICSFCLAILFMAMWWAFPQTFVYTEIFVWANLITGAINLLPAYPLDGGRILTSLLTLKTQSRKTALKICFVFNYVFSGIFLILFFLNPLQNLTFLMFAIFVFLGAFDFKLSGSYELQNFAFFEDNLHHQKNIKINQFAISSSEQIFKIARHLKKNQLNLMYVVFEDNSVKILSHTAILNLFAKFSPLEKIFKIFSKP